MDGISDGNVWNRWRLILGKSSEKSLPLTDERYQEMGILLDFLYGRELGEEQEVRSGRIGGDGDSRLTVPEWIRRVRELFPKKTVEILEKHALDIYNMNELVLDPEVLEKLEPNMELLKTILTLKDRMSPPVLDSAQRVVRQVSEELARKLEVKIRPALTGHLDPNRPSYVKNSKNLDMRRTIRRNLKHYDTEHARLAVEKVYFNSRLRPQNMWHVIIAVDESGSMAESVIYSAVMAGIFSRLPALDTRLVAFDTAVVDMSGYVEDPVELMMNVQLGGGTNIAQALHYCEGLVESPERTILVAVTDLYEGGSVEELYQISRNLLESGVHLIFLTALDAKAEPSYNAKVGRTLAALGADVGAMTPEALADWMGTILR